MLSQDVFNQAVRQIAGQSRRALGYLPDCLLKRARRRVSGPPQLSVAPHQFTAMISCDFVIKDWPLFAGLFDGRQRSAVTELLFAGLFAEEALLSNSPANSHSKNGPAGNRPADKLSDKQGEISCKAFNLWLKYLLSNL